MLEQFERTQWWPAEQLREHQFHQIERLLSHAHANNAFYRVRLDYAGFEPGRGVSAELWSRLPILRRAEIQAAGAALQSRDVPREHGRISFHSTSGSTGAPLRVAKTALADRIYEALTLRDHLWHRRDLSGKIAILRRDRRDRANYPTGLMRRDWGAPTSLVFNTGTLCMLDIRAPVEQQIEWLERERPNYLLTFPTNLEHVARVLRLSGRRLAELRGVTTFGEVVSTELRQLCRETLGVPIHDGYTAVELGCIALQCPAHEHYHVQAEGMLVEVLDPSGRPCASGEVGEIVITALHNFAMPLIRYAIGDLARMGEPCECGRGLPVLAQVLGRTRNLVVLPSGERRWANFGAKAFGQVTSLIQYQIVQRTVDVIEVKLVTRRPLTAAELGNLRESIQSNLGRHFDVQFTYHERIPRSESGKYEEFRCEVAN